MRLGEQLETMAYDIAFWLSAFTNPDYPIEDLGDVCHGVCAKLRTAAIITLLSRADAQGFGHNLVRSGRCRVSFLERAHGCSKAPYHAAASRVGPFFDAVAAGDFTLARRIVALSPTEWHAGQEYEDDWCRAQLAHASIAPVCDVALAQGLLERWERVLGGRDDAWLPLMRALALRDGAGFDAAFEGLLDQREREIAAEKARARIDEPVSAAAREVYVEGLAVLRIATQLGLPTQGEYRFCPSLARQAPGAPLAPEW